MGQAHLPQTTVELTLIMKLMKQGVNSLRKRLHSLFRVVSVITTTLLYTNRFHDTHCPLDFCKAIVPNPAEPK